jgi:hypothetical protein
MNPLMSLLCVQVSQTLLMPDPTVNDQSTQLMRGNYYLGYLKVILAISDRDSLLAAWLESPSYNKNLEILYFMQLWSQDDLENIETKYRTASNPGFHKEILDNIGAFLK